MMSWLALSMKWRAALWVLLAIGMVGVGVVQMTGDGRTPIQTNLLAMLPATERNPVAEEAVTRLTNVVGNRAIFLVGSKDLEEATSSAHTFARALGKSGALRQVVVDIPPLDTNALTAIYLKYRYSLLSNADRIAGANGEFNGHALENRLRKKLYTPFRFGLTTSPADDPFGFADTWLAGLPLRTLKLELENGVLLARNAQKNWVFVSAELPGSAYDSQVQESVDKAVASAEDLLRTTHQTAQVLRTGMIFYANAARQSAKHEVDLIGTGSLLGMLFLLYFVFRSMRPLALGLLSVGFGIVTGVAVTITVYGEIHLITLVFGASLIGEAIDYAIQYFAAHLGAGKAWDPMTGLRSIAPGITIALITSLLGYGVLLLAPFPALSQIALFAFAGLTAAWLSVILLLPALMRRPSTRDPEQAVSGAQKLLQGWKAHMTRRVCLVLTAVLLALAVPGWLKLSGNDDVHLLVARPPALVAQEEQIRELSGMGNSNQFFLVEGASADAVLAREELLTSRLDVLVTQDAITSYQALSSFVPSRGRQIENRSILQHAVFADPAALKTMFARSELKNNTADRQTASFAASKGQFLNLDEWMKTSLSIPFRHLWFGPTRNGFASIVLPHGTLDAAALARAANNLPGVTYVDKAGSVTRLFREYRTWGTYWMLGVLGLVYLILFVRYGTVKAAVTLMPTLIAMAITVGLFGYSGTPFTLFNLMGLMLVLGVGVNYAVFLREGGARVAATLAGVLLSAATTLLSFGLLSFSSMPALAGFGKTLLIGVGMTVVLSPFVLSREPGGA